MRILALVLFTLAMGAGFAHPGNGIVALSANAAITGDAVGNGLWRFERGKAPVRLAERFHCHWVTRGADGRIYAENLHETGGVWESGVYRLDKTGAKPELVLRNRDLGSLMFAVGRDGSFLFQREKALFRRSSTGSITRGWLGDLSDVSAFSWSEDRMSLWIADGNQIKRAALAEPSLSTVYRIEGTLKDALYAGQNRQLKIWGLAASSRGQVYAAVPAMSQVIRFDPDGSKHVVHRGADGWQPVGVDFLGTDVVILESRTVGRENNGPRVKVVRANGKVEDWGSVNR